MAAQARRNDTKLLFLKTARALTYIVYGFMVLAITFLSLGFVLLLFGANQDVAFTKFVYNVAAEFLQPFRGIFPLKPGRYRILQYFGTLCDHGVYVLCPGS